MGDESVLGARAGEAIETGNLPGHRPERVWGGLGSGAPCALCGKTVGTEDIELELQFAADGGSAATNYHVHAKCLGAWELQRRNGASNGHALPLADDRGIMPSRERNTTGEGERD